MTNEQRNDIAQNIFNECLHLLKNKGIAYSGEEDVNSNFKVVAQLIGRTKYEVWSVYFMKHILSILHAIEHNPHAPVEKTEGMNGRIYDAINYLIILASLIDEDKQGEINGN